MKKIQRVSDKIALADIKNWSGEVITISAGCGSGKSYFIKNILYKFAKANKKKILMLIHRSNCVEQFRQEVVRDRKDDIIHIKTYQSLESLKNKHKKEFDFSDFQYIVCDEFQYFMGDAAFNKSTDVSLDLILSQTDITRIFMSATGNYVKRYINGVKKIETIDYELPVKYNFIKSLVFFMCDDTFEYFIEQAIQNKQKVIFFIQSAEKAYKLYKKYKENCLFNCSKSNEIYYQYVDKDKIEQMLIDERFQELILISTTCLDAGVNIIDPELKHIVVDVSDIGSLIQCIGRKRIQDVSDKFNLYIKTITNQQLGGKETQLRNKLNMAEFFKKHSVKEYIEEYYKEYDKSHMVYDVTVDEVDKGTKKLNELMYFKCRYDIDEINTIKKYGDFGYCKYLARIFEFCNDGYYSYRIIEEESRKETLEDYLNNIIGKVMLQVSDRKELVEKIDVKSNGRRLKKINNLNGALEEMQLPFRIIEFKTSKVIDGKKKNYKSAWKVDRLVS